MGRSLEDVGVVKGSDPLNDSKRAGTSRTRVTAIANGNTQGVSTDVLIRVLAATGYRAEVRVKKSAA